jgi:hypothetical protein
MRDRFRVYKEHCCQGCLERYLESTILVFGKTLELKTTDNKIIALSTKK